MTDETITDESAPQYRRVNVKTVDGSVFNGKINITEADRVSDIFTRGDQPFLVMVDVTVSEVGGGRTLFVNKRHIVWVEPED